MNTHYLVIKCGHEGIEELTFLTDDSDKAKQKVLDLRQSIIDAKAEREKYTEDEWDELHESGKIPFDTFMKGEYGNPNQYCAQKWTGEKFECCCKELDVSPSEMWFM